MLGRIPFVRALVAACALLSSASEVQAAVPVLTPPVNGGYYSAFLGSYNQKNYVVWHKTIDGVEVCKWQNIGSSLNGVTINMTDWNDEIEFSDTYGRRLKCGTTTYRFGSLWAANAGTYFNITINTYQGKDEIMIRNDISDFVQVNVNTGSGDDRISIGGTREFLNVSLQAGSGWDELSMYSAPHYTIGNINMGSGNDTVTLSESGYSTYSDPGVLDGGTGTDWIWYAPDNISPSFEHFFY